MAVAKKESFETWIGTAAEKAAFTGMLAGDHYIETDTGKEYEYSAAGWINPVGVVSLSGSYQQVDAVIDVSANAKVSSEIDFRNFKYLSFLMPAAWDSATLTIYGSAVAGGTKVAITNDAGVVFPLMTVAVDKIYSVDVHALKLAGVHYLALVSSADQTADRTIKCMLKA